MDFAATPIPGAYVFTPRQFPDERGRFLEWFADEVFRAALGHPLTVAQVNHSVSRRGVVRGIHYADVPPGQGKYVFCDRGAVLDFLVDLRTGSPTFGAVHSVRLDDTDRRAVYLAEGLGHAFLALEDEVQVTYLCSTPYNPGAEHAVHPLDPELALPLPGAGAIPGGVQLSAKDAAAPDLATALRAGLLPAYDTCLAHYRGLTSRAARGE